MGFLMIRRPPRSTLFPYTSSSDPQKNPLSEIAAPGGGLSFWVSQWTHLLPRSEEHTSELQSPRIISYAVFCLKKRFF